MFRAADDTTKPKAAARQDSKAKLIAGGKAVATCCTGQMAAFRDFMLRGNVIDLAIAIVVGGSFTVLVNTTVSSWITPLITLIYGGGDFASQCFGGSRSQFCWGAWVNALITFIIVCCVCFWGIVVPSQALLNRVYPKKKVPMRKDGCPFCCSEVPAKATRCKFCTMELPPEKKVDAELDLEAGDGDEKITKARSSELEVGSSKKK